MNKPCFNRLLLLTLLSVLAFTARAQIDAGMYNTRYIYGSYTISDHYRVGINHSLFSEKFGFQQVGISAGYHGAYRHFEYSGTAFAATAWNGDYHMAGALIGLRYTPVSRLHIEGKLMPLYDSGYEYSTCYHIGGSFDIIRNISIDAAYTTIPDYRKSEKRLHGSFSFRVNQLTVKPTISLPVAGEQKYKNFRVLMSFNYRF